MLSPDIKSVAFGNTLPLIQRISFQICDTVGHSIASSVPGLNLTTFFAGI